MQDALKGITILEVGTMTPGKFAGFLMAGWGAASIRVERPTSETDIGDEDLTLNRGKQSIALNLRAPEGREILLKLVKTTDVFMESYRPGTAERLGIDAATIRNINPALVYCSLSGFGQSGPDRLRVAYDINMQTETGISQSLAGAGVPPLPDTYLADSVSGLMAAFAISAGLRHREATGEGGVIDLGIQESLFSLLAVSHGTSRHDTAMPAPRATYGIFKTADGSHISLGVARAASCNALFEFLGRPELAEVGLLRGTAGAAAREFLTESLLSRPAEYWISKLSPLDIEIAPVNMAKDAFENAQLIERGMVFEREHPIAGTLRQMGIPGVDARRLNPAPVPGADTNSVLLGLGYASEQITELRSAGVL